MKPLSHISIIAASILYFVGVILLAHFFAQEGYVWTQNTISELAAQDHQNKWIMQAGFIGFGILLNAGLIVKATRLSRINPADILLMLYGAAILITGFYCAKPIHASVDYSEAEARTHSIFATIAGFSLSAGMIWYLLRANSLDERAFHMVFLVLVTGISMAFGLAESSVIGIGKGIIQRVLYAVSFTWLIASQRGEGFNEDSRG